MWCWPCGQNSQPLARMPPTARPAPRGARLGVTGFDCGAGGVFYRRYATVSVASPLLGERFGGLVPVPPRGPQIEGREGSRVDDAYRTRSGSASTRSVGARSREAAALVGH